MEPKQAPPYPLRMPDEMRSQLEDEAEQERRSLNAHIVAALQERQSLRDRVESLELELAEARLSEGRQSAVRAMADRAALEHQLDRLTYTREALRTRVTTLEDSATMTRLNSQLLERSGGSETLRNDMQRMVEKLSDEVNAARNELVKIEEAIAELHHAIDVRNREIHRAAKAAAASNAKAKKRPPVGDV